MEAIIKKLYEYYEYVMKYKKTRKKKKNLLN